MLASDSRSQTGFESIAAATLMAAR